jgi:hypothetical protein
MSSSPSQSSIQTLINACVTGANYPATKMNPVLTFSNQNFNITNIDPTLTDDYSGGYINLKSFWFNTSSQRVFICVDDTVGGAVWIDITPNPVNPDAASIIDITRADLSNEIINGTVDPKAIYRITDAESGTSVMRVYGITTSTIDTNAFKEGDWDGFNFVAGEVGTYDLGTDTFASQAPNLQQVLDTGNTANGYTLNISGTPDNNVSITNGVYTGNTNVAIGQLALSGSSQNSNVGIGYFALSANTAANNVGIGRLSAVSNTGSNVVGVGNTSLENNTGTAVIGIGFGAGKDNSGQKLISIGSSAGRNNTQNDNIFIGENAGRTNTGPNNIAIGLDACKSNSGSFVIAIGDSAAESNTGDLVIALGNKSISNAQSNRFIIDNDYLPTFADHAAAALAITVPLGAIAGNTYLYHNQATDSIGAVRL